jgi:hypothetical protein
MSEPPGLLPPSLDDDPLRRALDCLPEGFQIIGFDWTYIYLNPAAARPGRRPARDLIGYPMAGPIPASNARRSSTCCASAWRRAGRRSSRTSSRFPTARSARVQPVPEGICIYSLDINRRMRAARGARSGVPGRGSGLLGWLRGRGA